MVEDCEPSGLHDTVRRNVTKLSPKTNEVPVLEITGRIGCLCGMCQVLPRRT